MITIGRVSDEEGRCDVRMVQGVRGGKKLREEVVKYFQPSMRVVWGGGGWCLVMSSEEGRRTARTKSEDDEE